MISIQKVSLQIVLILTVILACLTFASVVSAQEDSLSATIRAAITSDAQYENLSQEEIDAIVAELARGAQIEGITAEDIEWRPQETTFTETPPATEDSCGRVPTILCQFSQALGFRGDNIFIPTLLLLLVMTLIFLLAVTIEMHRRPRVVTSVPPQQNPPMGGSVPPPSY